MRKISPFGWLTLKTSLLRGLEYVEYVRQLQVSRSNLFHSTNTNGKKN